MRATARGKRGKRQAVRQPRKTLEGDNIRSDEQLAEQWAGFAVRFAPSVRQLGSAQGYHHVIAHHCSRLVRSLLCLPKSGNFIRPHWGHPRIAIASRGPAHYSCTGSTVKVGTPTGSPVQVALLVLYSTSTIFNSSMDFATHSVTTVQSILYILVPGYMYMY